MKNKFRIDSEQIRVIEYNELNEIIYDLIKKLFVLLLVGDPLASPEVEVWRIDRIWWQIDWVWRRIVVV